jgi:hypothetical protein
MLLEVTQQMTRISKRDIIISTIHWQRAREMGGLTLILPHQVPSLGPGSRFSTPAARPFLARFPAQAQDDFNPLMPEGICRLGVWMAEATEPADLGLFEQQQQFRLFRNPRPSNPSVSLYLSGCQPRICGC